jgi:hypothetical protein
MLLPLSLWGDATVGLGVVGTYVCGGGRDGQGEALAARGRIVCSYVRSSRIVEIAVTENRPHARTYVREQLGDALAISITLGIVLSAYVQTTLMCVHTGASTYDLLALRRVHT